MKPEWKLGVWERAVLDVRSGTSAILVVGVCDEADIGVTLRRVES